jgi:hypothetical protein
MGVGGVVLQDALDHIPADETKFVGRMRGTVEHQLLIKRMMELPSLRTPGVSSGGNCPKTRS